MIPEFPSYQNNNWQDLVEKFFEQNPIISQKFDDFCWLEFDKFRQSYDDYINDTQLKILTQEK